MGSKNNIRTGRVSSIDYERGTYEVTYFDRGQSVSRQINAMSNGEYKMPDIGQVVSVVHNSNGSAAACATGTIWNNSNRPAEGYKGLYRKEYSNIQGKAYEKYDDNTGEYMQCIPEKTGRNCNGDIYDKAKASINLECEEQFNVKAQKAVLNFPDGITINAGGATITVDANGNVTISAPNISATGTDGDLKIKGVSLVSHRHGGGAVPDR